MRRIMQRIQMKEKGIYYIRTAHMQSHTLANFTYGSSLPCISRCVYAKSTRQLRYEGLDMYIYLYRLGRLVACLAIDSTSAVSTVARVCDARMTSS